MSTNLKCESCETCKHYSESDQDEFIHGTYKAVFRNGCEIHEEPMYRYWVDKCKDWQPKNGGYIMSEWITDRKPEHGDGWDGYVWRFELDKIRRIVRWKDVQLGEPWMPITPPEPYVKPKYSRSGYIVAEWPVGMWSALSRNGGGCNAYGIPTREAAERIAAIYEEVMP